MACREAYGGDPDWLDLMLARTAKYFTSTIRFVPFTHPIPGILKPPIRVPARLRRANEGGHEPNAKLNSAATLPQTAPATHGPRDAWGTPGRATDHSSLRQAHQEDPSASRRIPPAAERGARQAMPSQDGARGEGAAGDGRWRSVWVPTVRTYEVTRSTGLPRDRCRPRARKLPTARFRDLELSLTVSHGRSLQGAHGTPGGGFPAALGRPDGARPFEHHGAASEPRPGGPPARGPPVRHGAPAATQLPFPPAPPCDVAVVATRLPAGPQRAAAPGADDPRGGGGALAGGQQAPTGWVAGQRCGQCWWCKAGTG